MPSGVGVGGRLIDGAPGWNGWTTGAAGGGGELMSIGCEGAPPPGPRSTVGTSMGPESDGPAGGANEGGAAGAGPGIVIGWMFGSVCRGSTGWTGGAVFC